MPTLEFTLTKPLFQDEVPRNACCVWKVAMPISLLFSLFCVVLWTQVLSNDGVAWQHRQLSRSQQFIQLASVRQPKQVLSQYSSLAFGERPLRHMIRPNAEPGGGQGFIQKAWKKSPFMQDWNKALDFIPGTPKKKKSENAELVDKMSGRELNQPDLKRLLYLYKRKLKGLTAEEALKMIEDKGAVLVDTRLESSFQEGSMEGAINLPIYVLGGNTVRKILNAALAVDTTELNPNYATQASDLLPKNKPIILACGRGGRLKGSVTDKVAEEAGLRAVWYDGDGLNPERVAEKEELGPLTDPSLELGWESRSLRSAYELSQLGFENIYFLVGGITKWQRDGFPMVGEYRDGSGSR